MIAVFVYDVLQVAVVARSHGLHFHELARVYAVDHACFIILLPVPTQRILIIFMFIKALGGRPLTALIAYSMELQKQPVQSHFANNFR